MKHTTNLVPDLGRRITEGKQIRVLKGRCFGSESSRLFSLSFSGFWSFFGAGK
ncbi:hypothetical protein HanIR_Chr14g0702821 [Helianthus annuus]|nr:hypothetical protein HanIR_Chr14g0702821 [Helianthus annuus]